MSLEIAETEPEIEKIKMESADYLNGLNSGDVIDYGTYSYAFDFYAELLDRAYEQGKKDAKEENGEWIRVPHPSIPTDIFRCKECGVYIKLPEKIDRMYYNFCPNCGKRNVNIENDIDNAK